MKSELDRYFSSRAGYETKLQHMVEDVADGLTQLSASAGVSISGTWFVRGIHVTRTVSPASLDTRLRAPIIEIGRLTDYVTKHPFATTSDFVLQRTFEQQVD
jgi:hypothetical protein